ncbi:Plasmodium vivax Vir protein, putative [Plasmodium vivax]|uniref:Vir protein, putative n=1 Tax=Plasmodium vivax TaxID=5855 RepID=A0A1G4HC93_PLAVI|nr:Plasmodium vivax Vir protein, putative [Plasmodium vivax]
MFALPRYCIKIKFNCNTTSNSYNNSNCNTTSNSYNNSNCNTTSNNYNKYSIYSQRNENSNCNKYRNYDKYKILRKSRKTINLVRFVGFIFFTKIIKFTTKISFSSTNFNKYIEYKNYSKASANNKYTECKRLDGYSNHKYSKCSRFNKFNRSSRSRRINTSIGCRSRTRKNLESPVARKPWSSRIESSIKPKKRKKKPFEHNYYEEYEKELAKYESENESLDSLEDRYYLTYQPDQDSYY